MIKCWWLNKLLCPYWVIFVILQHVPKKLSISSFGFGAWWGWNWVIEWKLKKKYTMTLCTQIYGPPIRLTNPFLAQTLKCLCTHFHQILLWCHIVGSTVCPPWFVCPLWFVCPPWFVCPQGWTYSMSTRVDIQYVQSLRGQSVWTNLGGHTVRPASLWTKCFKSRWTYSLSRVDNRFVHPQYWGLVLQLCGRIVCPPHFGAWTLQSVDQKIGWT